MLMIFYGFLFFVIRKTIVTGEVIRLINGRNHLEGELQVLKGGIWSYACYANGNAMSTKVMCRMLRNNTYRESYGAREGYLDCMYNITCSGNEQSIDECMTGVAYKRCLFHETVAVRCGQDKMISSTQSLPGIGVRLVNGYNQYEGKVEVGVNGTWRSVANTNNSWGNKEASVVCRMLGYSTKNASGFRTQTVTQVQCTGSEDSIDLCSIEMGNSCASIYYIYLYCSCISANCNDNSSRYCDESLGTCKPDCGQGRYLSGSYCNSCNAGTYQPEINQNRCYYCPFGTYQNLTGQSSCKACPVGKYLNMIGGQTSCNICPPGTFQDQTGQTACKECDAGTYQNRAEQTACIACEPGTYQNSSGKTICIPCAGGKTTARPGSITQSECYKRQRDDLRQQTNFTILIIGAALLAGMIIFDMISCAILLQRMDWNSRKSTDTSIDINMPSLEQTEFECGSAITNDAFNSSSSQDLQVTQKERMDAARHNLKDQDYETLHSFCNTAETYDVASVD